MLILATSVKASPEKSHPNPTLHDQKKKKKKIHTHPRYIAQLVLYKHEVLGKKILISKQIGNEKFTVQSKENITLFKKQCMVGLS